MVRQIVFRNEEGEEVSHSPLLSVAHDAGIEYFRNHRKCQVLTVSIDGKVFGYVHRDVPSRIYSRKGER